MTNDQLAAFAKELVDAAAKTNLTMRVLGAGAVYLACESIKTHAKLQREIEKLFFVAAEKEFGALAEVFQARGWQLRGRDNARWLFEKEGARAELWNPVYREGHRLDLSARLALASPTIPLADLWLTRLQRKKFGANEIKDAIALLLDHRVAKGEAEGQIDHLYLAQLTRGDWSLWTTVYDNTIELENQVENYLDPEEAQLVWRRIELIQGDMDLQKKSPLWMMNQILRRPTQVPR
ncbi:MAG: hypothetical protein HY327_13455 [Chloroflexi bacterium]|nr:hypothetical protein [Chloroflexota bacterium]